MRLDLLEGAGDDLGSLEENLRYLEQQHAAPSPNAMRKPQDTLQTPPASTTAPTPAGAPLQGEEEDLDALIAALGGDEAAGETEPTVRLRTRIGRWFRRMGHGVTETYRAAGRGALKGIDEMSNTVAGAAMGLYRHTGLYKLGRDEAAEQDFLDWYESTSTDEWNRFQFGEETRAKYFGEDADGGILGFIEGAAQFGVGMLGTGKFVKPLQLAAKLTKGAQAVGFGARAASAVGRVGNAMVRGAVADMSAFDPHADRFSDFVENAPWDISNPVTRFLQNEIDDTELEGRLKNALEGIVLGSTIDTILYGVRAAKIHRLWKRGEVSEEAAARQIADLTEAHEAKQAKTPEADEFGVQRAEGDEEQYVVVLRKADGGVEIDPEAPRFESQMEAESWAAAANLRLRNERIPTGADNKEFVANWLRLSEALQRGDQRSYKEILAETGMNMRWTQTPDEVQAMMKAAIDADPVFQEMLRSPRPKTWAETAEEAEQLLYGKDGSEVLEMFATSFSNVKNLPAEMLAMKRMVDIYGMMLRNLSRAAEANPDNALAMDSLMQALDRFAELVGYFAGTKTGVARALNILRKTTGDVMDARKADEMVDEFERAPGTYRLTAGMTYNEVRALARQIALADGDGAEIILALTQPKRPTHVRPQDPAWKRFLINFRLNAMLSGPKTLITNAVSNAIVAAQMPLEMWWAGRRSGNTALKQEGWDTLVGIRMYFGEAARLAYRAFKHGENLLDRDKFVAEVTPSFTTDNSGGVVGALGNFFQLPVRFLMATDEFFKQLNYRSRMRAQILRHARENGVTDPKTLARMVEDEMQFAIVDGMATNKRALQYAREATFTNDLEYGIGKWLQEGAIKHPVVRFIMPFVRTPVNIFRFSWQRTPYLARWSREYRAAVASGDPERIAMVKAREDVGKLFTSLGVVLALSGEITGAGPQDPDLRRQLKDAGWQPYSFRIPGTNKWVSYRRGDPTFSLLGVIADIVQMSAELDDDSLGEALVAVSASIAANVTSKTFMQGVSGFFDAMASGRADIMENFLANSMGSFIPNILRQMDPIPEIVETRGIVDEMLARVPGLSATLEPRRNLLGEKVLRAPGYFNRSMNPYTVVPGADENDVLMQLARLGERLGGQAFSMPSETMEGGAIDLTDVATYDNGTGQSPYDRMLEMLSEPEINLRGQLEALIHSDSWEKMTDELKFETASVIIQRAQATARYMVMREYPLLQQALGQAKLYNRTKAAKGEMSAREAVRARYENIFIRMK